MSDNKKEIIESIEIAVHPDKIEDREFIEQLISRNIQASGWDKEFFYKLHRKSLDARRSTPVFRLRYKIFKSKKAAGDDTSISFIGYDLRKQDPVIIVGAGPAGYFAALELIEQGRKPIILERGKEVQDRRRDLKQIQQEGEVNPHSNYCYGEGGAGTFSDGKLYTRSHKRGKIEKVLQLLVHHGAKAEILTDAHAHIGSNKLPKVIEDIRGTILKCGGEIHFDSFVTELLVEDKAIKGVVCESGKQYKADQVIIATGHSARDIYYLLDKNGVKLEFKPFALGVRVEHPQSFIDQKQLHQNPRHKNFGAAAYSLVTQVENRGVYSFCMCPGGLIVPSATTNGELVMNGMSLSKRDSPFANSGIVVEIKEQDLENMKSDDVKDWEIGLLFQKKIEQDLFKHGDGSQKAPAQRIKDFIKSNETIPQNLRANSYIPGIYTAPLHKLLPEFIVKSLRIAFKDFERKMKGFIHNEAIMVAPESRTSSPVRIPRNERMESPDIMGLYPCAEGAGYAGGIISAALDGQNVAKAIVRNTAVSE